MARIGELLRLDENGSYHIGGTGPSMEDDLAKNKTRKQAARSVVPPRSNETSKHKSPSSSVPVSSIRIVSPANELCGILLPEKKYKLNHVFKSVSSARAILLEEPKKAERLHILMLSLDNPTLSKDERAEVRETADSVRKQLLVEAKAHDSQEIPGVLKVRCRGITEYSTSSTECKRKLVASLGAIHTSRIKLEPPSTYVLPNGPRGLGLSNGEQIRVFCANLAKGETGVSTCEGSYGQSSGHYSERCRCVFSNTGGCEETESELCCRLHDARFQESERWRQV